MAKSSRASTVKANNQRLKAKVFGPVESARMERLSSKLLELAAAPKPPKPEENEMKIVDDEDESASEQKAPEADAEDAAMDIDGGKAASASKRNPKGRIAKRRKTSKIVFPKYSDRKQGKKR
ncbi:hypothetical protein JX266_012991 [Neoarthrinium moseri]|uniref:uncharacterized protein n=1 Tax=Neoarthrinium moseri TaxID=1658444 RepID=UPI001FDD4E18|nr:uncharacterized protein JN550_012846 [Neoarthrinium moseri]KAI1840784.1 hypothetical protein JX266_012991 [Neoarthrinium moseri]KAI1858090.1 hypothetical protein JN550_012846 [Neoarthrinium moseri]